jgi:hypothetical protein
VHSTSILDPNYGVANYIHTYTQLTRSGLESLFHPGRLSPDLRDTAAASRGVRQHQLARKTQLLYSVVGYELWQRLCRVILKKKTP